MVGEMLKNPRISFYDSMYGCVGSSTIYAGRDLNEKDFKKWFNHICKINRNNYYLGIYAEYDDNEDESFVHEISQYWNCLQMDNNPAIPF